MGSDIVWQLMSVQTLEKDYTLYYVIGSLVSTIIIVRLVIRGIQESRHYCNYAIPQQLIQLVRQAHLGQEIHTMWDIEVSEVMRPSLCAPLLYEQQQMLRESKDDILSYAVDGYVVSHKYHAHDLTGVVNVSIDITSKSGNWHYQCSNAKLRIVVKYIGEIGFNNKWAVTSVKQL